MEVHSLNGKTDTASKAVICIYLILSYHTTTISDLFRFCVIHSILETNILSECGTSDRYSIAIDFYLAVFQRSTLFVCTRTAEASHIASFISMHIAESGSFEE